MNLNIIVILIIVGGWLSGRLFKLIKLPSIMGMVLFGVLLSATIKSYYPQLLLDIAPFLKSIALVVILLRAGLGISKETLKKIGMTALLLSIIPCLAEGSVLLLITHYWFGWSWPVAGLTAFMLSAVSPAVIVPSMLNLKDRGIGKENEVPTLILAGASLDDVFAITLFSLFLSLTTNSGDANSLFMIASIPISVIGGITLGLVFGFLLVALFKWRKEKINATEKTLLLLGGAIMLVQIGDMFHIAALIGVMTAGFIILEKAEKAAHETSKKLAGIWIAAEITLFVLIGMNVDIPTALNAGVKGVALIGAGLTARSIGVIISTSFSNLSWKERIFCVISYWPKATVQAALGSIALERGLNEGQEILSFAVLAIIITAPLGLIGINISGKYLLKK